MRRKRRKLNIKAFLLFLTVLLLAVFTGYAGVKYGLGLFYPDPPGQVADGEDEIPPERMNLLLLGIDAPAGEVTSRADTILFVSADTKEERVSMLSIPRDTRVNIPGYGWNKINASTVYGGPELAVRMVSELIGQPIDYYVVTNFDGFKDIVDVLGGVTIDVETRMRYRDPLATPPLNIDLQPGEQLLDGDKALQYVRYRGDRLGDITRTERQQKFLRALASEMLKPGTILKLPRLVPKINACVETNLSTREMIRWAGFARKFNGIEMLTGTLPGTCAEYDGLSYWYVNADRAKEAAAKLVRGEEIGDPVDRELVQALAYQSAAPSSQAEPAPEPLDHDPDAAEVETEGAAPGAGEDNGNDLDGAGDEGQVVENAGDSGESLVDSETDPNDTEADEPSQGGGSDPFIPPDVADWPEWTGYPDETEWR